MRGNGFLKIEQANRLHFLPEELFFGKNLISSQNLAFFHMEGINFIFSELACATLDLGTIIAALLLFL